jgi:hypothetical protein
MAAATLTLTVAAFPNGVDNTQRRQTLNGTCALSAGGTYPALGVPFTWSFIDGNSGGSGAFVPDSSTGVPIPGTPQFYSNIAAAADGHNYSYEYDQVHGTLRIFLAGTEFTTGNAVIADTIGFTVEFARV